MFKSLLFLLVVLKLNLGESSFKRVCYYSNWSQNRKSGGEFFPEDIDPSLCSHVIFAFGKIANKTIVGTLDNDLEMDGGPGLYTRIMVLKQINPKLRILLAIGGWDEGSTPFESVLSSDSDLQTFSDNAVKFLRKWNFDGLDVDWEFPILNKVGFTKLLESLRLAFDMDAIIEDRPLILTAAVSAGQATIDTSYDIVKMEQFLDFINLMAYDLHTSWETKIGYHSALYAGNNDKFWEKTLNADWAVNYWIGKGMPAEKIVLGLAFYGRGYVLANPSNNQPGAASKGASLPGNYTNEAGVLSYFEICELIGQKSLTENYDAVQKIAWIQSGSQWIGYDNEKSLLEKATYIKNNCLGGFMIWTVDFDDYNGKFCKRGKYPLLKALNEAIVDATCSPKTTTTTTTQPSTTVISSTQTIASSTRPVSTTTTTTSTTSTTTTSTKVTTTTTKATTSTKTTTEAEKTTTTTNSEEHQIEPSVPPSSTTAQSTTTTTTTKKTTTTATTIAPTTVLTTTTATSTSGSTKSNEPDTDFRSNDSYEAIEPIVINYQTSGICTGSELVPSNKSCFHYEVCLKGFRRTVALLQCPEDKWFNPVLSTCVANPPKNCTKLPATTTTSSTTKSTTTKQSTTKTTTTEATTTTAAEQPEPDDSQTVYDCQGKSGTFKYNGNCQQFWHCSNGIPYLKKCPGNLLYNDVLGICDYVSPLCPSKKNERRSVDFLLKKYYKQIQ